MTSLTADNRKKAIQVMLASTNVREFLTKNGYPETEASILFLNANKALSLADRGDFVEAAVRCGFNHRVADGSQT